MQIKADLHVHTTYSKDSLITPKDLIYYAKKRGLNAVAVTDHNSLRAPTKLPKKPIFSLFQAWKFPALTDTLLRSMSKS